MDRIDEYTDEDRLIEYYDRKICRIGRQTMEKQKELDEKRKEIESSRLEMEELKKKAGLVDYRSGDRTRIQKG